MEDREILLDFRSEALEHLETVEASILEFGSLAPEHQIEIIATSFRALHSIKGAASFIGLSDVQRLSHSMEELLDRLRSGNLAFRPEMSGPLLAGLDLLRQLIEPLPETVEVPIDDLLARLAAFGAAAPTASDAKEPASAERRVRVSSAHGLAAAGELWATLRQALASRQRVVLDVSEAGSPHTGVLQVLYAFVVDARNRSVPVRWTAPDASFAQSVRLLGLEGLPQ